MRLALEEIAVHPLIEKLSLILCYPRPSPGTLEFRIASLRELGVQAVFLEGGTVLSGLRVMGKGHVGVVMKVGVEGGFAAAKLRRVDADRESMVREAEYLELANACGVGPRLMAYSKDVLLMELVEGLKIGEWLREVSDQKVLHAVVTDVLRQCRRLDGAGLDHGELSKAYGHVFVDAEGRPWIVDFETASRLRKPKNVTSLVQYLFLRQGRSEKIREHYGHIEDARLRAALRTYRRNPGEGTFEAILREIDPDTKL